jgi:hypothetical protein
MTSSVAERQLGRPGKVVLVGLMVAGTFLASADTFSLISFFVYMPVGAYLVARRPRNPVGWLLIGIAFAFVGNTTWPNMDLEALARGEPTLFDALSAWVAAWSGQAAFVGYLALTIIFPSGRLPQTGGRRTAVTLLLVGGTVVVLTAFAPSMGMITDGGITTVVVPNPVALLPDLMIWSVLPVQDLGTFVVIALLVIGVVRMVLRFRRSTGLERLQLRWLVAAVAFVLTGIVAGLLFTVLFSDQIGGAAWIPVAIAYPTIPLAIGIAVMRYRLFEIDRIVSRTIAYVMVTGVLAAVYAGIVLALSTVLAELAQRETIAVAASTLTVFAVFQPVLHRIRRGVDRRFNRAQYDAQGTVDSFSARLRHEVDIAAVTADLDATVRAAVHPMTTGLWVRGVGASKAIHEGRTPVTIPGRTRAKVSAT